MKKLFFKIINFFYPITCSVCGDDLYFLSQTKICDKCANSFPLIKDLVCQKCGLPLYDGGEHCYVCKKHPKEYSFDKMRSVYLYKDSLRSLILKFKYSNRSFLAKDFSLSMYKAMELYNFYDDVDFIIPVPLNIIRKIKRGYNQAELLANEISLKTNIFVLTNVLFRKKITKPQFKLSKSERVANIKDSFFVKNNNIIRSKTILLIDDIATTLVTVSACSLALKISGAKTVYVLTLARD
ncbi:MAG: ComF family protein [Endomicrobium sp.]|jgi:competence protein ComFC|nr:ComF family protein [Endomicrobium sp.]